MVSAEYKEFYQKMLHSRKPRVEGSILDLRKNFELLLEAFQPEPDIVFEEILLGRTKGEWSIAPQATKGKIILFIHGGGFNAGTVKSHRDLTGRLSRATGSAVLSVDYRLAPEHPFPAALKDCLEAYMELIRKGHPSSSITVCGCSAGGGLVLSMLFQLREQKHPLPNSCVLISPWADLTLKRHSHHTNAAKDSITASRLKRAAEMYIGRYDPENPLISPVFGDFTGIPPLLIQVGSWEILLEDAHALADKAKKQGVSVILEVWDEMFHVWPLYSKAFPEGRDAIEHIAAFLKQNAGHFSKAA